jgi:hypothetical protein
MSISDLKKSSKQALERMQRFVLEEYTTIEDLEWTQDVSGMITTMVDSISRQEKELKTYKETPSDEISQHDYEDLLGEQYVSLREYRDFIFGLAIIALRKKIEIHLKRIEQFSKPHKLTKQELKLLPSYQEFNELRCINNCIKHSEKVDQELSELANWKSQRGQELRDLESHFHRLKPHAVAYIRSYAKVLLKKF